MRPMPPRREELQLDVTLAELGEAIEASSTFRRCKRPRRDGGEDAGSEPREPPHLDERLRPIGDEQLLARVRALERRTGQRLIFPAR